METIAPTALAQSWDNVGLIAGDANASLRTVLLCIDLTPDVVNEAIGRKADLVISYHPPIFKPIHRFRADGCGTDAVVHRCIQQGIAIYSPHTALDAACGGTNDVLASLLRLRRIAPLEYVDQPGSHQVKIVVMVPPGRVEPVAEAMFAAGAGHIGDYSRCSFRTAGQGTFLGGNSTSPTLGRRGRFETVDETRLEMVAATNALPDVVEAMIAAHPYEEPAFDLFPLKAKPVYGIGRVGVLTRPMPLGKLAKKLKQKTHATCVQLVGPPDQTVERAVIVVGAAGRLPFRMPLTSNDVVITGEIRHHDALTIHRMNCTAVALGHWASERPVLSSLTQALQATLAGIKVHVSEVDRDPFIPA